VLENIDSINWDDFDHFFGSNARDIPQTLRNLTSSDPEIHQNARNYLYECLFHQGTVCGADLYTKVIPYLIEFLAEPILKEEWLLNFISRLVLVFKGNTISINSPLEIFFFQDKISKSQGNLYVYSKESAVFVCEAANRGSSVYQKILKNDRSILRVQAAYLLGLFTDTSGNNLDCLKLHFTSEADEQVRAAIVLSASSIAQDKQVSIQWLSNIFDTDLSLFVKINVAFAICRSDPVNVTQAVIKLLIDSIVAPDRDVSSMFDLFPWSDYPWGGLDSNLEITRAWCRYSLSYISTEYPQVLDTLIGNLASASGEDSSEIVDCILDIIFNCYLLSDSRPQTTGDKLSSLQSYGLEAIANSRHFQSGLSANGIADKLESHLLPSTPELLKAYLAGGVSILNKHDWEIPF
jgi:hypothetical protein